MLLLLQEVIAEESRHMEVDMIEESDANSSQWEDDRFLEEWVMHVSNTKFLITSRHFFSVISQKYLP